MRLGKLSNEDLERLVLGHFKSKRPEVLLPPGIGLDCSVVDIGDSLAVLSSDPITGSADKLGAIAVHVCCNDAAAAGADPVGIMTTLLLPPHVTEADIDRIAADVARAASEAGVDVLGGHTEVTDAVTRPILSATVLAKLPRGKGLIHAGGLRVGDDIVMSKWEAIEGSVIAVTDFTERLGGALTETQLRDVASWDAQLSVVPEGRIAAKRGAHALHDATEGGIYGAAWEMAAASGLGLALVESQIARKPETDAICAALSLDPHRLIASGSLLIGCADGDGMVQALEEAGIPARAIGRAVPLEQGVTVDGRLIPPPASDELWRLFERENGGN